MRPVFTLPAVPADQPAAVRITDIKGPLADHLRAEGAAAERARDRQMALDLSETYLQSPKVYEGATPTSALLRLAALLETP